MVANVLPIMSEVHRLVGAICVEATTLEHQLEDTVLDLAGSPAHGEALVRGERGGTLIILVKRLLHEDRAQADKTTLHELASEADRLLKKRDRIIHSRWLVKKTNAPGVVTGTHTTRSGIVSQSWTLEELEEVRRRLEQLGLELHAATIAYLADRN